MHTIIFRICSICLGIILTLILCSAPALAFSFNFIELKDYRVMAVEGLSAHKGGDNKIFFAKGKNRLVNLSVGKADKEQFASYFTKQNSPDIIFIRKEVRLDNDNSFTAFTINDTKTGKRRLTLFAADGQFFNVSTYACVPQLPFMLYAIDSKNSTLKNMFRTIALQKTQDDGEKWEMWLSEPRKTLPKFEAKVSMLDLTLSIAMNLNMELNKKWQVSEENNFTVIKPLQGSQESDLWVAVVPYSTPQGNGLNEHFYDSMRAILNAAGIANTTRGRYYGGEYSFYTSTGGMGSASLIGDKALIIVERNLGCSSQMANYFRAFLRKNYEPDPPEKSISAEDIAAFKKAAPTAPAVIRQLQNNLMQAVGKGDYAAAEKILQRGIDVNFLINGHTPLSKATQRDALGTMDLLFKYGAHADGVPSDHTNWTPLGIAAYNNSVRAAKFLIEHKADVNLLSHTAPPLVRAMMGYSKDKSAFVQLLLDHGADPNRAKQYGLTPLQFAVMNAKTKYLPLLLAKGGNLHVRDQYQKTLLMLIASQSVGDDEISNEDEARSMQILIDNKVDINAVDVDGKTALIHAAKNAVVKENVELLLKNGANPHMKDNQGRTAMYYAKRSPQKGIVALLRKYGAKE